MEQSILEVLKELSVIYRDIKFGLAGSYANGTYTKDSDVDIVLDASDDIMGSVEVNTELYNKLTDKIGKNIDLVWLRLLKDDSDDSDKLATELGISINEYTPYRNIMREAIWIE